MQHNRMGSFPVQTRQKETALPPTRPYNKSDREKEASDREKRDTEEEGEDHIVSYQFSLRQKSSRSCAER